MGGEWRFGLLGQAGLLLRFYAFDLTRSNDSFGELICKNRLVVWRFCRIFVARFVCYCFMNNQRDLEHLLVEELRKRNALEEVICEYGIETVRECLCCHRLMNEGWLFAGIETYCSDDCLMKAHPEENLLILKAEALRDDSDTYWTKWEG